MHDSYYYENAVKFRQYVFHLNIFLISAQYLTISLYLLFVRHHSYFCPPASLISSFDQYLVNKGPWALLRFDTEIIKMNKNDCCPFGN